MLSRRLRATDAVRAPADRHDGHKRRADIQGLRAIAVLLVVAFHAGLPIPGGFVGVDVFFVISGFVITAMLQREWQATERIALGRFYLRRFKRLTPALMLVVAVTVAGSMLLMSPLGPQQTAATTGIGAIFSSANIVIAQTTGDYFDAPAAANPLLHTWSLSVEEQFYLIFPLLLMVGWTVTKARARLRWALPLGIAIIAVVSFVLALAPATLLVVPTDALLGFYSPLGRMWEFAVGALLVLALPRLGRLPVAVGTGAGLLGGICLLVAVLAISESTTFPGPWTLLPVAATALLLVAGTCDDRVHRALALRPLLWVGDRSYSIYLWHWPLVVFAGVLWPLSPRFVLVAAALSFLPAVLSYRWLETPIRQIGPLPRRRTAALVAVVVVPVLLLSGGALLVANGTSKNLANDRDGRSAYQGQIAWKDHDYRFGGFNACTAPVLRQLAARALAHVPRCQQSKPDVDVDFALIGDSHVEHLFIGLMDALPERNIMYFTADAPLAMTDPQYAAAVDYVTGSASIKTVLVTMFWQGRRLDQAAVSSLLRRLVASGKAVYLTDDVPDFPFSPYGCKYRTNPLVPPTCTMSAAEFEREHRRTARALATIQRSVPGVQLLGTARYFCDDVKCGMTRGRDILYADPSHLNVIGSHYVADRLVAEHPELRAVR